MIIVMWKSDLNNEDTLSKLNDDHIQQYSKLSLKNVKDDKIIILDLNADKQFQTLIQPNTLAKNLIQNGLSTQVKTIDLLVSDVDPTKSLTVFASELENALRHYERDIEVRAIADLDYQATVIFPPSKTTNGTWKICVVNDDKLTQNNKINFTFFEQHSGKLMVESYENIQDAFSHSKRVFSTKKTDSIQFKLSL